MGLELAPSGDGIAVDARQGGVEPSRSFVCVGALPFERRQARMCALELLGHVVTHLLAIDPSFERVECLPHGIQLRITSAAAAPPSVPAISARTITPV